ncbi:hypothetical protein [Propionicimonas sp.]|uniref:hypothetical protein n=1 Tax=Propionicimonas sp. TaxID=1955623 RepID=UPI0039E7165C
MAVLVLLPVLTACAETPTVPETGHLDGLTCLKGGIIATTPVAARLTAKRVGTDSGKVYATEADSHGVFSLDLPPGTYELSGSLTARLPGGRLTPVQVAVAAGHTTSVEICALVP